MQSRIIKDDITPYLPASPIIIEAGAHIGRDTVRMSQLWPHAQIHAFEPVASLYQFLLQRTVECPNVTCYNSALSDHNGSEILNVSSGASTAVSSFYEPHIYTQERPHVFFEKVSVPTSTIDTWSETNNIARVDFMWLDMQGAELKVMQAAPRILSTVKALVIEASLTERFKGIPLYPHLRTWLIQQGFTIIQEDDPKYHKLNMLCVRL